MAEFAGKAAPPAPKSFARRDHIRANELRVQKKWDEDKTFERMPEYNADGSPKPKYMVTFPYPYMNGRLHLGHAFSLTKAEFAVRYHRLQGKNALWPFAFHCTGMPIQAAANKLRDEIEKYGCPPVFPIEDPNAAVVKVEVDAADAIAAKSKGKKSKLATKGLTGKVYQWNILAKMVPAEEIHEFADPMKWLEYFSPLGADDLKSFGCAIDYRRSFITTSVNQYYDKFIRWQFNRLKQGNRIKFGLRAAIYSATDKQVCADHDRASGEGVGPQEYTIVKLEVIRPFPEGSPLNCPALEDKRVFLAPATLRPETMYGQTNCFVLPEGDYGAYELKTGEVLVISARAALGMAHQDYMATWGEAHCLCPLKGTDLLGLPLKAPNATFERVYTLPLPTVSMFKGTGVVTSVPSDAPDDYVALKELQDKPLWREKFGITAEMVEPFNVVPIIHIEGYGNTSAVTMAERLDIKSCKEADKLKKAKDEVYTKGFYEGVMLVGECKGMKVCDAKPIVRKSLIESGDAFPYFEPEKEVISRTGDECVVALCNQWYLAYGEEDWKGSVLAHVRDKSKFNMYSDKLAEQFEFVINWLKEWACSRQFGLGTQLPWDEQWVIDSLSDSTIYMAYYTIAHHFHGDTSNRSCFTGCDNNAVSADQFNDDAFDYIFLGRPLPAGSTCTVPVATLDTMRAEFEYWYPMDLRVSAKDLIQNHLTMGLYNHAEIWKDRPEMWPKGYYCNGHIMVDAEKMSKSRGNFMMMDESIEEFTADGLRFALADGGDTLEDANFDRSVANNAMMYLFVEEEWMRATLAEVEKGELRTGGDLYFLDKAFGNEMDHLIAACAKSFDEMCFRDGIHRAWFDMVIVRDNYRDWSQRCGIPMHRDLVLRYINAVVVMMSPIIPHWSEVIWEALGPLRGAGAPASVCNASWPACSPCDKLITAQFGFFRDFLKNARQTRLKTKVKAGAPLPSANVFLASMYEPNKVIMLEYLVSVFDAENRKFPTTFIPDMKTYVDARPDFSPQDKKMMMQFGAFMKNEASDRGISALASRLDFDQKLILEENAPYIKSTLNLTDLSFYNIEDDASTLPGDKKKRDAAVPGKPAMLMV